MIQSNFQIAFKVDVIHSYFEHDICNCVEFKPGVVTQKLLTRFDFKIRNKINGFDFFVNSKNSLSSLLKYIKDVTDQTFFDFEINSNHSKFNFFTDLPVNWVGQLNYNSQADLNVYEDDIVQLSGSLSPNISTSCLGKLTVNFDDIVKFQNDQGCVQFNVRFKARSTQWQYFVVNKSLVQLNNPAITGKTDIDFEGPENVILETGQSALLFSSGRNLIPLSEMPKYKFNLVNNPTLSNSGTTQKIPAPQIILKGLPNPDPKRIRITKVNKENQVSSPMYVYV